LPISQQLYKIFSIEGKLLHTIPTGQNKYVRDVARTGDYIFEYLISDEKIAVYELRDATLHYKNEFPLPESKSLADLSGFDDSVIIHFSSDPIVGIMNARNVRYADLSGSAYLDSLDTEYSKDPTYKKKNTYPILTESIALINEDLLVLPYNSNRYSQVFLFRESDKNKYTLHHTLKLRSRSDNRFYGNGFLKIGVQNRQLVGYDHETMSMHRFGDIFK
jgi:hypothetical protein